MSTLEKFMACDMACALKKGRTKSFIGAASKRIWREVLKGLRESSGGASLSRAIIFKCAGDFGNGLDQKGIDKEDFVLNSIIPAFYESISMRKEKIENDPAWQAVMLAETEDERMDAIEAFMGLCIANFKNDCIEVWRNKDGTFANAYRKTQRALREHFKSASWSLYDPKSRFFGPEGMEDPLRIDELRGEKLKEIPLPQDAPQVKRIFYRDSILPLSAWFYSELNSRTPQESEDHSERTCVAVRNLARWLCFAYPLLASEDSVAEEEMAKIGKTMGNEYGLNTDIDNLARKAADSLTAQQRLIIVLKMDGYGNDEIASKVGLSDPDDINDHMNRIRRVIRDASLELPEMREESGIEKSFSDSFMRFCSKGLENAG